MTAIELKILTPEDVTDAYVSWLRDPEITKYSDNYFREFSLAGQKDYVAQALEDPTTRLFGILAAGQKHIGNVALVNINEQHSNAEVTFLVGDRDYAGKGIATEAVGRVVEVSRSKLCLSKVYAGCASPNEGSRRVLLKNGFQQEGRRKCHLRYGGEWMDQLDFGLLLS